MKHLHPCLLFVPLVGLLGVGACSSGSDADTKTTTTVSTTVDETTTTGSTTSGPDSPVETTTAPETTAPAAPPAASPLAGFEEYATLQTTIPGFDVLQPIIETDNPNSRVILFQQDNGRKLYKSVFVKRTNRLKIISLDGGGPPLFDAAI